MSRMTVIAGLLLVLVTTGGCKQQCYLTEPDANHYLKSLHLPANLECDTTGIDAHPDASVPVVSTVLNPDQEIRYISLAEAIAIALEQGTEGNFPGIPQQQRVVDRLDLINAVRFPSISDNIRVFSVDPALVAADIESALSKFDVRFTSSLNWNTTDRPIGTALDAFQAGQQRGLNSINQQDATFNANLLKPLPTGGVAGITFRTDYQFTNLPARVNPSYRPALQFQFEQPLLQGFGVEINQLRGNHPGSILTPFQTGSQRTADGILIARSRYDQSRAEFQRRIHNLLVNVETTYWNLYGAYGNLYSREVVERQSYELLKINQALFNAGRIAVGNLAQIRGQYWLLRSDRLTAVGQVLEAERALRNLLGMPISDGKRLVPADAPTLASYQPDWQTAVYEVLAMRPELVIAREDLKLRQLDLINLKNLLLPDLRFTSTYDINAIGSRLDGPDATNALRNLASNHNNNWAIGLRFETPLGRRDAHAGVRVARLNLGRSYYVLQDQERKAVHVLGQTYRLLFESYQQIALQRAQREAYGEQIRARLSDFQAGRGVIDNDFLQAQRFYADALSREYANIVQYNNALAAWEYSKGTILQYDNVVISEGPLPECAQVRAVEHERERCKALVLRERANPVPFRPCCPDKGVCGLPELPKGGTVSVPALLEQLPKTPTDAAPETLGREPELKLDGPAAAPPGPSLRPGSSEPLNVFDMPAQTSPAGLLPTLPDPGKAAPAAPRTPPALDRPRP